MQEELAVDFKTTSVFTIAKGLIALGRLEGKSNHQSEHEHIWNRIFR